MPVSKGKEGKKVTLANKANLVDMAETVLTVLLAQAEQEVEQGQPVHEGKGVLQECN